MQQREWLETLALVFLESLSSAFLEVHATRCLGYTRANSIGMTKRCRLKCLSMVSIDRDEPDFRGWVINRGSFSGGTTDVRIEIYIESIGNFKAGTMVSPLSTPRATSSAALSQDYDMDIYFVEFWTDKRLRHNFSSYLSFNERRQLDRIW